MIKINGYYLTAEEEIADINRSCLHSHHTQKIIELYDYQEEFIKDIHENKYVSYVKARCAGLTFAYVLHVVFTLKKFYTELGSDKMRFLIVAPFENMLHEIKKIAYRIMEEDNCSFKFVKYFDSHVIMCTPGTLKNRLIGCQSRDFVEVYFDEYAFLKKWKETFDDLRFVNCESYVCVTSIGDTDIESKHAIDRFLSNQSDGNYIRKNIPWFRVQKFNRNLFWERNGEIMKEPVIDSLGNVKYDKEKWTNNIIAGWQPKSDGLAEFITNFSKNNIPEILFFS